jgi:hypothetical protein
VGGKGLSLGFTLTFVQGLMPLYYHVQRCFKEEK